MKPRKWKNADFKNLIVGEIKDRKRKERKKAEGIAGFLPSTISRKADDENRNQIQSR